MAYKVIILYRLYMPPYFLGTFTEYPYFRSCLFLCHPHDCCLMCITVAAAGAASVADGKAVISLIRNLLGGK